MRNLTRVLVAAAATALVAGAAHATDFDASLGGPGVYYGTGNHDGHFTIETFGDTGQLGLRAHERFQDATSPSGDVYSLALGADIGFDFSFNPFGTSLDGLISSLTITNVGTGGTATFDPLGIGDNYHSAGAPGGAQNSEPLNAFFFNGFPLFNVGDINYNSGTDSTYTVAWTVSGTNFAGVTDTIVIKQGAGAAVPEPAAWALMLVGFGGLGAVLRASRRQRRALAAA